MPGRWWHFRTQALQACERDCCGKTEPVLVLSLLTEQRAGVSC